MELSKYQNVHKDVRVSEQNIIPYIMDLSEYMSGKVELKPYPNLIFSSDARYEKDPFGKTAFYDPERKLIVLYTAGRHIKDVLRSFAHEMIHHNQNITGMFSKEHHHGLSDPRYAEHDEHLAKMEADAYLRGNMLFRTWDDQYK
jgi:hypothetical protein